MRLLLLLCSVSLCLTNCTFDDEGRYFESRSGFYVDILEGGNLSYYPDEPFELTVRIVSDKPAINLEVFENGRSIRQTDLTIFSTFSESDDRLFSDQFSADRSEAGTTKTISFVVTNEIGETTQTSVDIFVIATRLNYLRSGVTLNHYYSGQPAGWNLVGNEEAEDSTFADIWLSDRAGLWQATLKSQTTTTLSFLETGNEPDLSNLSSELLSYYFEQGDTTLDSKPVAEGDLIVARLRASNEFSLIQVTEVASSVVGDREFLRLNYWKKSEDSGE